MENQLFDLMTKMYSEMHDGFTKINNEITDMKFDIKNMKTDIKELKNEVTKTNVIIEHELKPRIEALFDGYKQNTESIKSLDDEVKDLRVSINNLNIKTIQHENNIIAFSKQIRKLEH